MAWQEPKTDWVKTDIVSFEHYNRIKNNIAYVNDLARSLYSNLPLKDMGDDKDAAGLYFADEWNVFEENIHVINNETFTRDYGEKKVFYPNGPFVNYEELNRLERATLMICKMLAEQKKNKKRLSIKF